MADKYSKHIQKLVSKLQSSKANVRYEACEYLRVAPSLPPEAIQALQTALTDPDKDVRESAQRALNVHLTTSGYDVSGIQRREMADKYRQYIHKLMIKLQSSKASVRYEACEYLRVSPRLPLEAIKALQTVLTDPDKDVRESAQSALNIHLPTLEGGTEGAQEEQDYYLASVQREKSSRLLGCCLAALALFFVPYVINALILLGGNIFNSVKWHMRGSSSYTSTVELNALSPNAGTNIITVKDGKVIAAKSDSVYATCTSNLDECFGDMTVESMFSDVGECIVFFPFSICLNRSNRTVKSVGLRTAGKRNALARSLYFRCSNWSDLL